MVNKSGKPARLSLSALPEGDHHLRLVSNVVVRRHSDTDKVSLTIIIVWRGPKFYFTTSEKSLCQRLYMGGSFYEARIGVRCGEQRKGFRFPH